MKRLWSGLDSANLERLAFVEDNQKSYDYTCALSEYLLPFAYKMYGCDFIFQQDAVIYTSRGTKMWLNENNLSILDWPAKSLDINPIEKSLLGKFTQTDANMTTYWTKMGNFNTLVKYWSKCTKKTCEIDKIYILWRHRE